MSSFFVGLDLEDATDDPIISKGTVTPYRASDRRRDSNLRKLTINQLQFHKLGYYGQEIYLRSLNQAWDRCCDNNHHLHRQGRELVMLSGDAGAGKSSLVSQFKKDLLQKYKQRQHNARRSSPSEEVQTSNDISKDEPIVLFAMGKYDQMKSNEAESYVGISAACVDICRSIKERYQRNSSNHYGSTADSVTTATTTTAGTIDDQSIEQAYPPRYQGTSFTSAAGSSLLGDILYRIRTDLGEENIKVLTTIMPSLEELLIPGDSADPSSHWEEEMSYRDDDETMTTRYSTTSSSTGGATEIDYLQAKHRFNYAFRSFIRCLCNVVGPLVLVLDDLQWCDLASFDVIEGLLDDVEANAGVHETSDKQDVDRDTNDKSRSSPVSSPFMLIGCYRQGEVDDKHRLHDLIAKYSDAPESGSNRSLSCNVEERKLRMTSMSVGNLSLDEVYQMVADVLLVSLDDTAMAEKTMELATITHSMTLGEYRNTATFWRFCSWHDHFWLINLDFVS